MNRGRKFGAMLLATSALILSACTSDAEGASDAEGPDVTLRLNSFFPEEYPFGQLTREWAEEISAATEGRVEIDIFASGSLTSASECYQSVINGTADICHTTLAYNPGRFPMMEALDLPGWTGSGPVTSQVAQDVYEKFQPEELQDTEVMFLHAHPPGALMMANEPVASLEDLDGQTIRTTGLSVDIFSHLGAQIVAMPVPDAYDPLQRGVIDGTLGSYNNLKYYRHSEVLSETTIAQSMGYVTTMAVTMGHNAWEQFTPEEHARIEEINDGYSLKAGELWDQIEQEGVETALDAGHEFQHLSPEEEQRWFEIGVVPSIDEYIEESGEHGFDGEAVWQFRQEREVELLEQYEPFELPE